MPDTPLKNDIINWLRNQNYWLQYAGNQLLEGSEVDDILVDKTYQIFKEEWALTPITEQRAEIEFNELPLIESHVAQSLSLLSIHSIENVNALALGQGIDINRNLTIIYGNNGTGKSGYIRLLNNAFNTRGDKTILGNVFDVNKNGTPKCKFVFQTTEQPYEIEFPTDRNRPEFSQYSAFDTQSVKVHLDNDNQLNFTPIGFEFFDLILQLFESLKSKLNLEIQANRPANSFLIHFQNDNAIRTLISNLNANSSEEEITKIASFSQADSTHLTGIESKIAELRALNIQVQIVGLEKLQRELQSFCTRQQLIIDNLSKEKVEHCLTLIDNFHQLLNLSKEQGIKSLEEYPIINIGSPQWREFIIAARKYSNAITENRKSEIDYPLQKDTCIFCLQPLAEKENSLIHTYWQFLRSEAEREMNRVLQQIKDIEKELKGLPPVKFDDTLNLYGYLNSIDATLVLKWKKIVQETETSRQNLIKNLGTLKNEFPVSFCIDNTSEFNKISLQIKQDIDSLFAKKPDQEIATLSFQKAYLTDKSLLSKLLPEILKFIAAHKWALKAENSLSAFRTNSITSFQGSLFSQHITHKYSEVFNKECDMLNAPKIVEIIQQNSKAKTFRKLQVAKQTASQILSEGEQRAISLADFLTEIQLNPYNRGVIFDDPVTSLDHQRRAIIAQRLVELSKTKQVIIFTHDLLFVNFLKNIANDVKANFQCHWIEKISNVAGVISNNNSPATEGDYKTVKFADAAWQSSRKATPTERERILKEGFAALRTNYEYLIIFDLFKQVVLRFDERVSVERLKEVVVLPEYTAKLIDKVGLLSRYIEAHLHSDTFLSTKPTSDDLRKEIDDFIALQKELSIIRKDVLTKQA